MAELQVITEETQEQLDRPAFEPFSWSINDTTDTRFAGQVRDIAKGIATVMEMVEYDELQRDCTNVQRLMTASDAGALQRFAISAAHMLAQEAERHVTAIDLAIAHRNKH